MLLYVAMGSMATGLNIVYCFPLEDEVQMLSQHAFTFIIALRTVR